jgi:hypothetical protein
LDGLNIIARSMSVATKGSPAGNAFQYGNAWQYHPRSDRHSKIACWALMFDLVGACGLLREHLIAGKVAIGINHTMRDFARDREKNLDLVVCRAAASERPRLKGRPETFAELVEPYTIQLQDGERAKLAAMPEARLAQPASVLMALEAKACMTEFGKARPRLYDELNSSHLTIHGDNNNAIAAGFALLNAATTFVSPLRNPWPLGSQPPVVNRHNQPQAFRSVAAKLAQLRRRSRPDEEGFDALAIAVIECANDGSPVTLRPNVGGRDHSEGYDYPATVSRLAHIYATRFSGI